MDIRRLELLLELSRLGSMRAVADASASPRRRSPSRSRRWPGRPARRCSSPTAGGSGSPRPGGGSPTTPSRSWPRSTPPASTWTRRPSRAGRCGSPRSPPRSAGRCCRSLAGLRRGPPATSRLRIHEHEPAEALELLAGDDVDLALTYDYNLAPGDVRRHAGRDPAVGPRRGASACRPATRVGAAPSLADLARFRDHDWIVNSRNTADEEVVRTLASLAGFQPRVVHRADSLDLVQDLIAAGLGVGLLPEPMTTIPEVGVLRAPRPRRHPAGVRRDPARARRLAAARAGAPAAGGHLAG